MQIGSQRGSQGRAGFVFFTTMARIETTQRIMVCRSLKRGNKTETIRIFVLHGGKHVGYTCAPPSLCPRRDVADELSLRCISNMVLEALKLTQPWKIVESKAVDNKRILGSGLSLKSSGVSWRSANNFAAQSVGHVRQG